MGHLARILAALAMLGASTLPLAAFEGPTQTSAPKKKASEAQKPAAEQKGTEPKAAEDDKQKAAALAQRALDAGIKAYEAGKADQALRAFETALRGGLTSQQMARALYYRGLTYRRQGKPGLAISDLTSAVWLKDGLNGPEREEALKQRLAAYHEAGISDVPEVPQSAVAAADTLGATGWQTAMSEAPAPAKKPAAEPAPAAAAAPSATAPPPPQPTPVAALPASQPAEAPPAKKSSSGISGFFSSLFGGGTSSAPNAQDGSVSTSSISQQPQAAPAPQTTSWSATTTEIAAADPVATPFVTKVATTSRPEKAAARAPSGKYRLQVAAVRSRGEADALAASLLQQHAAELGPRTPEVDEAVIGSMGTFYRVRLGPFADAKEPQRLCVSLRSSGFDCLVVTQ